MAHRLFQGQRPRHRRRALGHVGPGAVRSQPGGRGDGFLGAADDRAGVYLKQRVDASFTNIVPNYAHRPPPALGR